MNGLAYRLNGWLKGFVQSHHSIDEFILQFLPMLFIFKPMIFYQIANTATFAVIQSLPIKRGTKIAFNSDPLFIKCIEYFLVIFCCAPVYPKFDPSVLHKNHKVITQTTFSRTSTDPIIITGGNPIEQRRFLLDMIQKSLPELILEVMPFSQILFLISNLFAYCTWTSDDCNSMAYRFGW